VTHLRTRRWATHAAGLALTVAVGGAAATGTVAAQTPAPAPPAVSSAAPATPAAPAAPATRAAPAAPTPAEPAGDTAGNTAQQQADPHKDDLLVPDWLMLVIAIALVAGAVSLATQSYIRFSRTRRELEG
jgi:hypothetical protein